MAKQKPYVEVAYYCDRGDPYPPNNYRPELVVGNETLLLDFRKYGADNGCMPKSKANSLAKKIANDLGLEAKLAE